MVGKEDDPASYWVSVTFQGRTVKLREGSSFLVVPSGQAGFRNIFSFAPWKCKFFLYPWVIFGFTLLSPIIMEVEHGGLEDDFSHFSLPGGHFQLP